VSKTGSDIAGDGSSGAPWATPKHGCARIGGGDTLVIHEGTYSNADVRNIVFSASGNVENPIIVTSAEDEGIPILDAEYANDEDAYGPIFNISGRDYIILDRLDLRNGGGHTRGNVTIGSDSASHHVTVQNCRISSISRGGETWTTNNPAQIWIGQGGGTHDIIIRNNEIFGDNMGEGSGIKIQNVYNLTIENNEFHNLQSGIANKYGNSASLGHIYRNNFFHECGGNTRGSIWSGSPGTVISNNLIINGIGATGIEIANAEEYDEGTYPVIMHNTVYGCGDSGIYLHASSVGSVTGARVFDNVVVNSAGNHGREYSINLYGEGLPDESDHNCFYNQSNQNVISHSSGTYSLNAWKAANNPFDQNSINVLPTFANISGNMNIVADFEITGGLANNSASDNGDMGADVSLVGINAGQPSDAVSPASPTGLSVS